MIWVAGFNAAIDEEFKHKAVWPAQHWTTVVCLFPSFVASGNFRSNLRCLFAHVSHLSPHKLCLWGSHVALRASSDAPARLKRELDMVLRVQADLDVVDNAIKVAKAAIANSPAPSDSKHLMNSLQRTHDKLKVKVEELYTSLNIPDSFPELEGVDLEFVRILLMARDLKINIRKRAIGSFFEWAKLDQAVGGRGQALGEL